MTRVAAFDCGTNSLRLLIADVDQAAGTLAPVERRTQIVRLGQGVDATGRLDPEALRRTLAVTEQYAQGCREAGVERIRFVATSATRDAANRAVFTDGVQQVLGVVPEVISGETEARLSFEGATRALRGRHPEPFLVVDLGGGSTEFVLGDAEVSAAMSVDVGSVRLTERHLRVDPPSAAHLAAATGDIESALDRVEAVVDLSAVGTLVGVAGTVTTVTAHALRLPAYDSVAVHGSVLEVATVLDACDDLLARGRAGRLLLPTVHPGRADVLGAGALIWRQIVRRVADRASLRRVVTSEQDILDGIAWSLE